MAPLPDLVLLVDSENETLRFHDTKNGEEVTVDYDVLARRFTDE
jgi:hypothetical protein